MFGEQQQDFFSFASSPLLPASMSIGSPNPPQPAFSFATAVQSPSSSIFGFNPPASCFHSPIPVQSSSRPKLTPVSSSKKAFTFYQNENGMLSKIKPLSFQYLTFISRSKLPIEGERKVCV
jgi:hypothetical protein